jgi:cell division protein FtsN
MLNIYKIISFILVSVILGYWYYLGTQNYDPPILQADKTPTKIKYTDNSNNKVQTRENIYNTIKSQSETLGLIKFAPEPETPIEMLSKPKEEKSLDPNLIDELIDDVLKGENPHAQPIAEEKEGANYNSLKVINIEKQESQQKNLSLSKNSLYYLQILSSRSKSTAQKEFDKLKAENKSIFEKLEYKIVKYESKQNSSIYHILIGPFNNIANAKSVYKKLSSANISAIIKKTK